MNLEKELDYLNQTLFKMSDVVVENMTEAMAFYLGKKIRLPSTMIWWITMSAWSKNCV